MTAGPVISVAIPAYNAEAWIAETLESVLGQTEPPEGVVVVDDGSQDGTAEVVRRFGDAVRLVAQPNAGCGAAFNTAIEAVAAEYVALCPADDLWVPEKLAWQRETLRSHPEVDVSFGAARNFGANEDELPRPSATGVLEPSSFLAEMFEVNRVPDPTVVLRRDLHRRLGGFLHPIGEDYEFWMRALQAGAVFHADPRVLARLRQHGGNLSSNALAIHEMTLRVREAARAELGDDRLARRVIARNLRQAARANLGLGRVAPARAAYRASLARRPSVSAAAAVGMLSVPGADALVRRLAAMRSGA